ncbi:Uncharacterized protein TCM_019186 [Theobroma cacao]|uniref:Uncharacterized protein n=1 Tax=Theobroma cacao TaxID=3641 RepID=A0A061EHR7_THECC|nr:Uncharacterized protein TCM_019186 [Theobroma cacao]
MVIFRNDRRQLKNNHNYGRYTTLRNILGSKNGAPNGLLIEEIRTQDTFMQWSQQGGEKGRLGHGLSSQWSDFFSIHMAYTAFSYVLDKTMTPVVINLLRHIGPLTQQDLPVSSELSPGHRYWSLFSDLYPCGLLAVMKYRGSAMTLLEAWTGVKSYHVDTDTVVQQPNSFQF